jgi:hypothetical protein
MQTDGGEIGCHSNPGGNSLSNTSSNRTSSSHIHNRHRVVALIAVVYFISGQSTLKVRINSEHWISTVNFELYLDGDRKKTGSISPGSYYEYTFTLYPGPSCTTYNVFASSVGGTFGGESDSENVYLCAGETKSVDLYI